MQHSPQTCGTNANKGIIIDCFWNDGQQVHIVLIIWCSTYQNLNRLGKLGK